MASIGLAADGTGKKKRARTVPDGVDTTYVEAIMLASPDLWVVWNQTGHALNKYMLSILNGAGSTQIIKIRRIFKSNSHVAAVTTALAVRWEIRRITAHAGGLVLTPVRADTNAPALNANITARGNASPVTEGALLRAFMSTNTHRLATQPVQSHEMLQSVDMAYGAGAPWVAPATLGASNEVQSMALRPGEGIALKVTTNTSEGIPDVFIMFSVEEP